MNTTKQYSRLILYIMLCIVLFILMTGCSTDVVVPSEVDPPDNDPVHIEEIEETKEEELPEEVQVPRKEVYPKIEGSFPEAYEAYLDVLIKDKTILTDELLSALQISASNIDIGDGKIVIVDVFGDETPELLYIYTDPELTEFSNHLYLRVYTFSKEEGAKSVFDSCLYYASGGGSIYSVYLTKKGDLMVYFCGGSVYDEYGFWPIAPMSNLPEAGSWSFFFVNDNNYLASLYAIITDSEDYCERMHYGKAISNDELDRIAKEIMSEIDCVLFQGPYSPEYGLELYKCDYWKDVTPFEENYMTYNGATSWLEAQIDTRR